VKTLIIAACLYDLGNIKGGVEAATVNLLKDFKNINNLEL